MRNNAIEVDLDTYARINPFPRFQNLENGVNKFLRFLFVIIRSPSISTTTPRAQLPFQFLTACYISHSHHSQSVPATHGMTQIYIPFDHHIIRPITYAVSGSSQTLWHLAFTSTASAQSASFSVTYFRLGTVTWAVGRWALAYHSRKSFPGSRLSHNSRSGAVLLPNLSYLSSHGSYTSAMFSGSPLRVYLCSHSGFVTTQLSRCRHGSAESNTLVINFQFG